MSQHPQPIVVNQNATQAVIIAQYRAHKEVLKNFEECENIERTLKQQIIATIDKQYLRAIIHTTTSDIQLHVHEDFEYIYRTYGHVTVQTIQDRETEVKAMTYDPLDPIDNIFNEIGTLTDIVIHANVPFTQAQCMNIA